MGVRQAGSAVGVALEILMVCGANLLLSGLWSVAGGASRHRRDKPRHVMERSDTLWQRAAALVLVVLALGLAGAAIYAARFIPTTTPDNAQHPTETTTRAVPRAPASAAAPSHRRGTRSGADCVVAITAAATVAVTVGYAGFLALRRGRLRWHDNDRE